MADSSNGTPAGLTCMSCQVVFANAALQRDHYKADWHRYNLKRKVAELPPITAELFARKEAQQHQITESQLSESDGEQRCVVCNKTFRSAETFNNHCQSKKHLDRLAAKPNLPASQSERKSQRTESDQSANNDDDADWSDVDSDDEGEGIPVNQCLFCSHVSNSCETSLQHMLKSHDFFIPDLEFCTDVEGLIHYLGYKVGVHYVCVWCNARGRAMRSLDAVQKHMRDKQHCKMATDTQTMLEYSDYYDYSASYPDGDAVDADSDATTDVLLDNDWQLVLPSGEVAVRKAKDINFMNRIMSKQRLRVETKQNKLFRNRGRGDQTGN